MLASAAAAVAPPSVAESSVAEPSVAEPSVAEEAPAELAVAVEIEGIDGALLGNAEAYLEQLRPGGQDSVSELLLPYFEQRAVEQIKLALTPFGYYKARVKSAMEALSSTRLRARFTVEPGPRTRVTAVEIALSGAGVGDPSLERARASFPLADGDPLLHQTYEDGKTRLLNAALRAGYAQARYDAAEIRVDPEANSAAIVLHLDTGPVFRFGRIRYHQQVLNDALLALYVKDFRPGEIYSQDRLQRLQQALIESGYFARVDLDPHLDQANHQASDHASDRASDQASDQAGHGAVPIDVRLTPVKRYKLSFGVGADTDIGPFASVRAQDRLLNRRGHRGELFAKLAPRESILRGSYWIPGRDPRTDRLGIVAALEHEKTDSTRRDTFDFDAVYYFEWKKWQARAGVQHKLENFETGSEPETTTRLISIGGRIEHTVVEKDFFPRRGWFLLAEASGAPGLYSDTAYVRGQIEGRYLMPLGGRGRLSLRGQLGAAEVSEFDQYPASLRFFAGGNDSVRGYEYKSLGPEDDDGDVVGGRNIVTGSIEYDHRVLPDWAGAAFFDFGNAFNDSLDKVYTGAGVGLRWRSPIGTVFVDFAWPLNKGDDDPQLGDLRLHFGFGAVL